MVSRVALLPGVNRNFPQVLDQNGFGLLVYASKNNIYVVDCRSLPPLMLDQKTLRNCHDKKNGRILSLSCCKTTFQGVVTSGEDNQVKIWDLETASNVTSLEISEPAKTVEWLHDSVTSVVFSAHKSGLITKWNFSTNHAVKMKTASEATINVMSSNPKCPEFLAVGHSNGMISIMNVVNHTLAYRLKTHSQEIASLSWSLVLPDLLLSASLDMSARIWKLKEDTPIKSYYFPSSRYKIDDKNNLKLCSIFHPTDPDIIIVSNVRGDLGAVTFKDNEIPKFTRYTSSNELNFKFVNIMRLYFDEKDGKKRDLLLSCDHLKLGLWDVARQSLICILHFTTGHILKFSLSMLNSNYMAICASDGSLRVWNTASEESMEIAPTFVHFRVKITSAAWHPIEENIIAFGTNEGRVGIIDTFKRRPVHTYEAYHERSVYTVAWGPCCKIQDTDDKFFLYSCGGKVIHIDELKKPKQKPLDFFTIIEKKEGLESSENTLSEFCWKMDYSCIVVGCTKGFIDIYNDEFKFLTRFTMQVPTVEFLRWHPEQTSESPEGSPYKTWLAVSGRYENIHIIDVADEGGQFETTLCKPTVTLVGHKDRVSSVCWSPHTDGYLASASKDGTVQIWNVITNTRIANYICHMDFVSSVQWSIFDADIIYSGGGDSCLRIWNISQQTQTEVGSISKNKICKSKTAVKKLNPESELTSKNNSSEAISSTTKEVVKEMSPNKEGTNEKEIKVLETKFKGEIPLPKKAKSLFFSRLLKTYTKEGYLESIITLADYLCLDDNVSDMEKSSQMLGNIKEEQDAFKYGLFSNQMAALKLLEIRAEDETKLAQSEKATCIQIMACNTESLIREAGEKNRLTEFHVALAPSVSYDFWLEVCEKYGKQLIEAQQYIKGSMYLITCGKVYEAINTLLEKGLVLDALVLAKSRLPESDPVIRVILHRATTYFNEFNLIEAKTLCYIALRDASSAARVLYCTNDSKSIYTAAYICKKFRLKEAEDYAYFCMEKCLLQNDWPTFYKLTEHIENFKVYKTFVRVHELITSHLKVLKKEEGLLAKNIFGKTESQLCIWNGRTCETGQTVLAHMCDVLKAEGILPDDKEALENILKALDSMVTKRSNIEVDAEAHISIAIYATKVLISSLLEEMNLAKLFFCHMFSSSYNIVFLPKVVCWLFLPFDMYYCSDTRKFIFDLKNNATLPFENHFRNIHETLHSTFACIINSDMKNFSLDDLQCNFKSSIEKVVKVLSEKYVEESVMLYFIASYISELQRCTKKGWKYTCIENPAVIAEEGTKKSKDVAENSQCTSDFDQNGEAVKVIDTSNEEQNKSDDNQSEIKKLIDMVCAEAVEKALKIVENVTESKIESAITVNESDISLSPDEADYCFIENENNINISQNLTGISKESKCMNSNQEFSEEVKVSNACDSCDNKLEEGKNCLENYSICNNSNVCEEISASVNHNDSIKEDSPDMLPQTVHSESDIHKQCWNEVSLCYDLTKSLISVICKDEYAALYYLELYVQELNRTLTHMAKAETKINMKKSVTIISKKPYNGTKSSDQLKGKEQNSPSEDQEQNKNNTLEHKSCLISAIKDSEDEVKCIKLDVDNCVVDENLQNDHTNHSLKVNSNSDVKNGNTDSELNNDLEKSSNSEEISDKYVCVNVNSTTCKMDSEDDMLIKSFELKTETMNDASLCSGYENGVVVSCTTYDDSGDKKDKKLEIGVLKEWISSQIKTLKSQEFCYPNPFDSVANVKGICYNIFHKHPCQLVKAKFHELSHDTIEWTNKFKTGATAVTCDICGKEVQLNSS